MKKNMISHAGLGHHLEVASWDLIHCSNNDMGVCATRPEGLATWEAKRVFTFLMKVRIQAEKVGW